MKGIAASSGKKKEYGRKQPGIAFKWILHIRVHFVFTRFAPLKSDTFVVGSDKAQDVVVSQHDGLIDVCLPKPRPLVPGGEDLHGHVLPSPLPSPHLAEATLANGLLQDDGARYGPLHQQGESCKRERLLQTSATNSKPSNFRATYVLGGVTRSGARGGHVVDQVFEGLVRGHKRLFVQGLLGVLHLGSARPKVTTSHEHNY